MSQWRSICFTLNNPTDDEVSQLKVKLSELKYAVFQLERGESGTLHVQGYAVSATPKRLGGWKTITGARAHIERAAGTAAQNREYCTKEEGREPGIEPWEHGRMPVQGQRNDIEAAVEEIKEGATIGAIIERHPEVFVKYSRGLNQVRLQYQARRRWKTEVFWFYGATGTGKSLEASERFPEAYYKMPTNKWWDGYDGDDVVIIDDYRRDLCSFGDLLRLFDRYPLLVESKGGTINFLARTIVVTTPKSPRETWEGRSEEDIKQLLRRVEHVKHFVRLGERVVDDGSERDLDSGRRPEEEGEGGLGCDSDDGIRVSSFVSTFNHN